MQRIEITTKHNLPDAKGNSVKLDLLEEGLDKSKRRMKMYEFWEEGFGNAGMKSYLLDDVADFLNRKVSEFTDFLTEGEINIDFQTQKRLKSGSVASFWPPDTTLWIRHR